MRALIQSVLSLAIWQLSAASEQPKDEENEPVSETKDERVLCVPAESTRSIPSPWCNLSGSITVKSSVNGPYLPPELARVISETECRWLPRSEVETDPTWKQIIPYVVLRCGKQIFVYPRGEGSSETRLHAKLSLGIGGHISESEDSTPFPSLYGAYVAGFHRELFEEVKFEASGYYSDVGIINDDSDAVGRVHVGVVHVYDLHFYDPKIPAAVTPRENHMAGAKWMSLDEIRANYDRLERWSQIVLDNVLTPPQ